MDHRATLFALDIRAPLTNSLIWSLLTNPQQPNFNGKKYFHKMLKRALMTKMMIKVCKSKPQNNEMRVRTLCVCRNGAANGNPCLLYWYRFLQQDHFFVGSAGSYIQNSNKNDFISKMLMDSLPETNSEECWKKAEYAYNTGNIEEAIRLFALFSCFSK
jgi:hypothetical protein